MPRSRSAWVTERPTTPAPTIATSLLVAGTTQPYVSLPPLPHRTSAGLDQRVPSSISDSRRRMILPDDVIGSCAVNWMARGTL